MKPSSGKGSLPDCAGDARFHIPCPRSGSWLCLYSLYPNFPAAKQPGLTRPFLAFLLQSSAKSSSPEKNPKHLIRFSQHIHLDPRDLLNSVLPAGNTREGLLQPLTNTCQEGFTCVTVMLCKIKSSLKKSSCKRTPIPVSDENLNNCIVCWVLF